MRPSFIPRLVNGPFEDPALFVPMTFRKRALLFDLGELKGLSSGDILKISHVFVSHTHMDHFAGFDQLLRLHLGRGKSMHLFGPQGFVKNVMGKLQSYTWNLVQNYDEGLNITATEIGHRESINQTFRCRKAFAPTLPAIHTGGGSLVYEEPGFRIQTAILDHRTPSLAFALKERFHINILKPKLEHLGLEVGPWISRFKELVYKEVDPASQFIIEHNGSTGKPATFSIGELTNQIARITPGQKIAYVADALYSDENNKKIVELAYEADHLYIEAAFLEEDSDIAREKYHLTAFQAGTLARKARVRALSVFHHSPRYLEHAHLLQSEAMGAFEGRQP